MKLDFMYQIQTADRLGQWLPRYVFADKQKAIKKYKKMRTELSRDECISLVMKCLDCGEKEMTEMCMIACGKGGLMEMVDTRDTFICAGQDSCVVYGEIGGKFAAFDMHRLLAGGEEEIYSLADVIQMLPRGMGMITIIVEHPLCGEVYRYDGNGCNPSKILMIGQMAGYA